MFGYKITALAVLAAGVAAQNLPSCASNCVGSNYAGCSQFDVTCICSSSQWIAGLACCVSQTCNAADQDATIQYANKICAGVGITTLPQTATCSSTASSAAAAGSTSSPGSAGSASASTTTAGAPPVGASGAAGSGGVLTSPATSSGTGAPTGGSSIVLSGSGSPASSAARQSQSGSANKAGSIGMGAVIAGLAVAAL